MNQIEGKRLNFGDNNQIEFLTVSRETETVTDRTDRQMKRDPEPLRWTCPACGLDSFARGYLYAPSQRAWCDYLPIITPRIYRCHNSRCGLRRFYWRDGKNNLLARFLSKYELIDELEFTSNYDPLKFYLNLKPATDPNQTSLF